ncbi:RPII140-upstream gene protein [Xylocopa sonorina]|uniref:RPII140-upstream gene protein n=1 Tax=Xylocopa sonorina TaxID=1818115 RepID=UPI00403B142C
MFRAAVNRRLICAAFFPFTSSSEQNSNELGTKISKYQLMKDQITDRINEIMFDETGHLTKEIQSIINVTIAGCSMGFVSGGLSKAGDVPLKFKQENQATLYKHKFFAHRELQSQMVIAVLKGGYRASIKLGLFCFFFSSTALALYLYRGYFDVINHTLAGAVTGFLFKVNLGLKGAISGSVVGSLFGTLYGIVAVAILYLTGSDIANLHEAGMGLLNTRRKKIVESSKVMMAQEESEIKLMYKRNQELKEKTSTEGANGADLFKR